MIPSPAIIPPNRLLRGAVELTDRDLPSVRDDLAAGRLKLLDLPEWSGGSYAMQAIHRTDTPPGPAGAWMIRRFSQEEPRTQNTLPEFEKPSP
jgi:hypothetical protein